MSDTGQIAAPIVRYAAFAMPQGLFCRNRADTADRQATRPGEFRACGQKFPFVSPESVSPKIASTRLCRGRHTPQPGSDGKRTEQARMLPFSQYRNIGATPLINVLFFPCEVE